MTETTQAKGFNNFIVINCNTPTKVFKNMLFSLNLKDVF